MTTQRLLYSLLASNCIHLIHIFTALYPCGIKANAMWSIRGLLLVVWQQFSRKFMMQDNVCYQHVVIEEVSSPVSKRWAQCNGMDIPTAYYYDTSPKQQGVSMMPSMCFSHSTRSLRCSACWLHTHTSGWLETPAWRIPLKCSNACLKNLVRGICHCQ